MAALRLAAAIAVLGYASLLDLRTRRAPNFLWMILSTIGILMIVVAIAIDDAPVEYSLILIPILVILSDVFWDSEGTSAIARNAPLLKYSVAIISVVVLAMVWGSDEYFQNLLAVPVLMVLVVLMYMLDLIRGGADAKALISLSILFPTYPTIAEFPLVALENDLLETIVPFTFSVLVNAAILVVFIPLAFLGMNLYRRDLRFPQMFLGIRMDGESAKDRHVWLMERIEDGERVFYSRPKMKEDLGKEIGMLKQEGHSKVWVTPKIPFIIPISVSVILTAFIGNPFFMLFGL